jgi:serine phosphatase RsbU (regulator of sigma subunit)
VGGDFFDYIELPGNRAAVLVGDVVGHGIAAALLMAKVSAETRFALASETEAAAAMNRLNRAICRLQLERFVTMALVLIDPAQHQLTVVNAGHLPPMLNRHGAPAEALSTDWSGLPVGVEPNMEYEQHLFELQPGEFLVMYTDGISEAIGPGEEMFGRQRILELMDEREWEDGTRFGSALVRYLRQHLAGGRQEDDICLVCISRDAGTQTTGPA